MDSGEQRLMYAQESPINVFEDFGSVQLVDGVAEVAIDPLFAQAVNTAEPYYVFLTPGGECNGLFISEMKPGSFVVRELHAGQSDISFAYRIVAKRRGYEELRMEPAMAAPDLTATKVSDPAGPVDLSPNVPPAEPEAPVEPEMPVEPAP